MRRAKCIFLRYLDTVPDTYCLRRVDQGIQIHSNALQHGNSYKTVCFVAIAVDNIFHAYKKKRSF